MYPASTDPTRPREIAKINPKLDRNLTAYMVAAAGAAGVSIVAAQSAEAKVVYTPKQLTIAPRTALPLDLNNDGVNDFVISNWQYDQVSHLSVIHQASANGVISKYQKLGPAADLAFGVEIGPNRFFEGVGSMATEGSQSGTVFFSGGPWKNAHERYLGLKFSLNGETHYGWARLTVTAKGGIVATLTGYAYETVPNKPISAGRTSGPIDASEGNGAEMLTPSHGLATHRSATLGMLAGGADRLAIWRREDDAPVTYRQDKRVI
jgi:hypothetical protein